VTRNHPPVKLVDGSAELKASLAYFKSGRLTIGQWLKDRGGKKNYVIFRHNDVGPFFAAILRFFGRIAIKSGRVAKRMIRSPRS
jgi:hypothetical protein